MLFFPENVAEKHQEKGQSNAHNEKYHWSNEFYSMHRFGWLQPESGLKFKIILCISINHFAARTKGLGVGIGAGPAHPKH